MCDGLASLRPELDRLEQLGVEYVEFPKLTPALLTSDKIMREQLRRAEVQVGERPFGITIYGPIGINLMGDPWKNY